MVNEFTVSPITEGKAIILVPQSLLGSDKHHIETKLPVFYNPKMKFNRDISIIMLNTFMDLFKSNNLIVDALAGTGVRAIRYGLELTHNKKIIANDINPLSTYFIKRNIELNFLSSKIEVHNFDANHLLHMLWINDISPINIDIDPFGSPVQFYDYALETISKPGLLSITATDTAVLCGVYPNVAFRKYGGISINNEFCHEIGIRLLIYSIAKVAMRHDYVIVPLASLSTDHYMRIWIKVIKGRNSANKLINNFGYVVYCPKCMYREVLPISKIKDNSCPNCKGELIVGGPLWIGPIFDQSFINKALKSVRDKNHRVLKVLTLMDLESKNNIPFYYNVHLLSKLSNVSVVSNETVINELLNLGYIATRTHFNPNSIRSNAPISIIKSIIISSSEKYASKT